MIPSLSKSKNKCVRKKFIGYFLKNFCFFLDVTYKMNDSFHCIKTMICSVDMSHYHESEGSTRLITVDSESDLFSKVADVFKTNVAERYGDQTEALAKIARSDDRQCMVLVDNKKEPLGLLVCKTTPNSEYATTGVKNSLEIRTILSLTKDETDSRRYIKKLLRQAEALAKVHNSQSLHVTVSGKDNDMRRLLRDCDFRVKYEWLGRYKTGVTEYLMSKSLDRDYDRRTTASSTSHSSSTNSEKKKPISITLMKRYIHHIKAGRKTVEGRVATQMFKNIRAGDVLRFFYHHDQNDDVVCEVLEANRYSTFREMLEKEGTSECIPGMNRVEEGVRLYQGLPGYKEKEAKFGVIAFKLKVIKK